MILNLRFSSISDDSSKVDQTSCNNKRNLTFEASPFVPKNGKVQSMVSRRPLIQNNLKVFPKTRLYSGPLVIFLVCDCGLKTKKTKDCGSKTKVPK
jgi:hypothetical protein